VVTLSLIAMLAAGFYVSRPRTPAVAPAETAVAAAGDSIPDPTPVKPPPSRTAAAPAAAKVQRPRTDEIPTPPPPVVSSAAPGASLILNQAVEALVSPQADLSQRRATWKQLIAAGKLDETIAELERRVAGDPRSVATTVALGEGNFRKAGETEDLRERDQRKAELVKLRYFAGLTIGEAAELLHISEPTAKRDWTFARAWLYDEIQRDKA
jgi:hypothetical protein